MKTIVVTGGTGFLGSHLCSRLIREHQRVICVDNNYTGRMENIAPLLSHPYFRFIHHDICTPLETGEAVDQIYNLACPASPRAYQGRHAVETTKTCVFGVLNMLDLAVKYGASLLQSSTSEVYGDPLEHPQRESYRGNVNPVGPRACYDEGKRCAESLLFDYWREKGVAIKIVRVFNTYGPKMDPQDGRVVSNFICQALRGEDITVYGDGSQTRSFCYVDDMIEALLAMMNSPREITGPVNVGNPAEFSIADLASLVLAKTGGASRVVHKALPVDDPLVRRPDISLARKLLGWQPQISLSEGLDRTIPALREVLQQRGEIR